MGKAILRPKQQTVPFRSLGIGRTEVLSNCIGQARASLATYCTVSPVNGGFTFALRSSTLDFCLGGQRASNHAFLSWWILWFGEDHDRAARGPGSGGVAHTSKRVRPMRKCVGNTLMCVGHTRKRVGHTKQRVGHTRKRAGHKRKRIGHR